MNRKVMDFQESVNRTSKKDDLITSDRDNYLTVDAYIHEVPDESSRILPAIYSVSGNNTEFGTG